MPPSLCTVCNKSKVPNYFLIKCISCSKNWHHRCHSPPIPDLELIAIIRAFNDARARSSAAALNWKCGACRKVKPNPVDPAPKPRTASTKDDPIVVVDDDDEEVKIIHPPVKRQESSKPAPSRSKKTSAKVAQPVRIIDDPIDFLISPSSNTTLASEIGHLSVSDDREGVKQPKYDVISEPTRRPISNPELHSQGASTPSHPYEYSQAQLETSENQQTPLPSSRARLGSAHQGSADEPSSPRAVPALAPPSLDNQWFLEGPRINTGIKQRPFLERWSMANVQLPESNHTPPSRDPPPLFHPALLPHHLNSRYRNSTSESESDKKTDVWYLGAIGKSKIKDTGTKAASDASHPRKNRKSRAVHHETEQDPFYFSVNTWMKQNEDALNLFETIT